MDQEACLSLYCYVMGPIDEFFRPLSLEDAAHRHREAPVGRALLERLAKNARLGWSALGMTGATAEGPDMLYIPFPGRLQLSVGLIQRQVSAGATFVATFVPMHEAPWFAEHLEGRCVVDCASGTVSGA